MLENYKKSLNVNQKSMEVLKKIARKDPKMQQESLDTGDLYNDWCNAYHRTKQREKDIKLQKDDIPKHLQKSLLCKKRYESMPVSQKNQSLLEMDKMIMR